MGGGLSGLRSSLEIMAGSSAMELMPPLAPFSGDVPKFDALEFRVTVADEPGEMAPKNVARVLKGQWLHAQTRGAAVQNFLAKYGMSSMAELPAMISSEDLSPLSPPVVPPTSTTPDLSREEMAALPM